MADTVLRNRYLVIRRGGVITQRLQVRVLPSNESPEVDPYAGPIYRDFDTLISGDDPDLGTENPSILAEFEVVATTQTWEIQFLE